MPIFEPTFGRFGNVEPEPIRDFDLAIAPNAGRTLDSFTPTPLQPYAGATPGVDLSINPLDAIFQSSSVSNPFTTAATSPLNPSSSYTASGIMPTQAYTPSTPQTLAVSMENYRLQNQADTETVTVSAPITPTTAYTPTTDYFTSSFGGGSYMQPFERTIEKSASQIDPILLIAALGFGALIILKR